MTTYVIFSMATLFLVDRACAVPVQYSVMLDAGSSSTKLRVYSWPERKSTSSTLQITENFSERIKPSLSSFQDSLELLPKYLLNITSIAESQVPFSSHNKTHIYLLATAGKLYCTDVQLIVIFTILLHNLITWSINDLFELFMITRSPVFKRRESHCFDEHGAKCTVRKKEPRVCV